MLTPPDIKVIRALYHLGDNDDFKTVLRWLEESNEQCKLALINELDEIQFRQKQGECRILQSITDHAETADEMLRKLTSRKP